MEWAYKQQAILDTLPKNMKHTKQKQLIVILRYKWDQSGLPLNLAYYFFNIKK